MREIEFRGRTFADYTDSDGSTVKKGTWVYGVPVFRKEACYLVGGVGDIEESCLCVETWARVDPETVGQCVPDVLDVHGNRIFEGDVVKCCFQTSGGLGKYSGSVVYIRKDVQLGILDKDFTVTFAFKASSNGWEGKAMETYEVLGNLYENPELLDKENET